MILIATPAQATTSYANDYFFTTQKQWALTGAPASINAPMAWCHSTGAGIVIGHIDTGADFNHPDLQTKLIPGASFTSGYGTLTGEGQQAVQDDAGHGTLTAGLLVASTNNRQGIAAIAPDSKALVVKVLNEDGRGYAKDIAAGIRYATDHQARVINLSIGTDTPIVGQIPDDIPRAIDYATQKGTAVAIAAGSAALPYNQAQTDQLQAQALVVNALAPSAKPAYYSKNPRGVNIWAPGGDDSEGNDIDHLVISTHYSKNSTNGYAFGEGASFASPMVAGTLALLMAKGLNAQEARQKILDTAQNTDGIPRLDAARALGATQTCGGAPPAPPIGTVTRPPVTEYRGTTGEIRAALPPTPPPTPDAPVTIEGKPTLTQEQQRRPITINLGPWIWILLAALVLGIFRSRRKRT